MSSFEHVHQLNPNLAQLAEQIEQSVWANPRTTLIQGRLFGEQLAALVSTQEKVEPVYAIKQVDRLHRLAHRDIISPDIRTSFEWLRMNGNTAAHNTKEVPPDLALTAHRHVYLLGAWYVETYGALNSVISEYRMPLPPNSFTGGENTNHSIHEFLDDRLEQLLQDQLADKLLPSIDERFREMNELLVKVAGQMDARSRNETEHFAASNDRNSSFLPKNDRTTKPLSDRLESAKHGIELADYLTGQSLSVVDKRKNGGALWVVGGWELKDVLFGLKEHRIYFKFARHGSQSTKRKPAWFLTGRDSSKNRYLAAFDSFNVQTENAAEPETKAPVEVTAPEWELASEEQAVSIELDVSPDALLPQLKPENVPQLGGTIRVPAYLNERKTSFYKPSRMSEVAESLGVISFSDWTEDRFRELYRHQPKLLHDTLVQLWFYGFDFTGELGRFIKLERPVNGKPVPPLQPGIALEGVIALDIARQLERFGIRTTDQLVGMPDYSLQWLLRHRYESVKEFLQHYMVHETGKETDYDADSSGPAVHTVRYEEFALQIPIQLLAFPIKDLPIQGCSALLRGIINSCHVSTLGELPVDLAELLPYIKGAGTGAMRKMITQLIAFISQASGVEPSVVAAADPEEKGLFGQLAAQSKCLVWGNQVIELDDADLTMPIPAEEYPSSKRLTGYLDERGITEIGLLPAMLVELTYGESIGKISVDKFMSQLLTKLEDYRSNIRMQRRLQMMSMVERVEYFLRRTEEKLTLQLSDEAIRRNRNLQLLHARWSEKREGRKGTLEWLGQKFGLTRERVRQIIRKELGLLRSNLANLQEALIEACTNQQAFVYYPLQAKDMFLHGIIEQIIEESEGLVYLERYGWWTALTREEITRREDFLRKDLNSRLRGQVWEKKTLQQIIQETLHKVFIPLDLAWDMMIPDLSTTSEGKYYLSNSKKRDVVEMVLRQFPEGVEVYKREAELMVLANTIKPGEYVKERDFAAVFSRDDFLDTAYLWGRGMFIHHEFVHVDEGLIKEISAKALELLETRSPISVNRLFQLYEERLPEGHIPTEYALYTMLRKLGSEQLSLHKFPHIWHSEDAFQLNNAEQIKMHIREQNAPVAMEHLREEFVGKRGWKKFSLDFSIQMDSDFVSTDLGIVGLREFYPYSSSDLEAVADKLKELLVGTDAIHVNRLYEQTGELCTSLGIGSTYLLYDLMKEVEDEGFRMIRYPLILSADHPAGDLTLQTLVERYLEEQEAEVPREVVYHWITEEVGARAETLDMVLRSSNDIFYYKDGKFGEYIHRTRFGWTEEKELHLVELVNGELEHLISREIPYATISELLQRLPLPELMNSLAWTEDLLIDCLRKSGCFQWIGSYHHIVVRKSCPIISCETDWLTWLLRSEFGGRAERTRWQRRLAELKFSKEGKLLYETMEKIEADSAPFLLTDEEVVLVEL